MRGLAAILSALAIAGTPAAAQEGFVSGFGDEYTLVANPDGMILSSVFPKAWFIDAGADSHVERGTDVLFLGRSCDAFHRLWGKGRWGQGNAGFSVMFADGRAYGFPRQELPAAEGVDCRL